MSSVLKATFGLTVVAALVTLVAYSDAKRSTAGTGANAVVPQCNTLELENELARVRGDLLSCRAQLDDDSVSDEWLADNK